MDCRHLPPVHPETMKPVRIDWSTMKFAPGAWRYALPPILAAPFALFYSVFAGLVSLSLGAAVLGFFRDPDRTPPPTGIVSPADGKVSVLRTENGRVRLGVFMNVWNVHVTRAPFDGVVEAVEHTPGANRPAFSKDSDRNERVHVRFRSGANGDDGDGDERDRDEETGGDSGASTDDESGSNGDERAVDREVTLVAGAFARRIHPYVEPGDDLDRGERLGHIAFGSRVDVVFPPDVSIDDVVVSPGDRITAGETVILETGERIDAIDPNSTDEFGLGIFGA